MKKRKINKHLLLILIVMTLLTESVMKDIVDVNAGTNKVTTSEKSYLFAVPEGGWSTITVYVSYTERQVKHETKNKWWRRELYYAYKTEYATEKPYMKILNNIKHIDSDGDTIHKFTKWTRISSISDAKWDYFATYRNGKNMYYKPTTKNCASVSYLVFCNGSILCIPASAGYTIKMRLNTE